MRPLPRAGRWVTACAYPAAQQRLYPSAEGDGSSSDLGQAPSFSQRASDAFLGPHDPVDLPSEKMGIDFAAGLAVVTGDVAMGADAAQGLDGIRLLLLANRWWLRSLAAAEQGRWPNPLLLLAVFVALDVATFWDSAWVNYRTLPFSYGLLIGGMVVLAAVVGHVLLARNAPAVVAVPSIDR